MVVQVPRPPRLAQLPDSLKTQAPDLGRWIKDANDWLELIWKRSGAGTDLISGAQPYDDDLQEISDQTNTTFGLDLLTLADDAALRAVADVYSIAEADATFGSSFMTGTYTPTLFNTTNVAVSTSYNIPYIRIGSIVIVSGRVDITATAAPLNTLLGMSLPIASTFASSADLGGSAGASAIASSAAAILADTVNNRARFLYPSTTTGAQSFGFTFMYRVI